MAVTAPSRERTQRDYERTTAVSALRHAIARLEMAGEWNLAYEVRGILNRLLAR